MHLEHFDVKRYALETQIAQMCFIHLERTAHQHPTHMHKHFNQYDSKAENWKSTTKTSYSRRQVTDRPFEYLPFSAAPQDPQEQTIAFDDEDTIMYKWFSLSIVMYRFKELKKKKSK